MRFHIHHVSPSILHDYAAMNPLAAKSLGFKGIKPNELLIEKGLSKKEEKKDILHEKVEYNMMKQGKPYWKAHEIALKAEKKVK